MGWIETLVLWLDGPRHWFGRWREEHELRLRAEAEVDELLAENARLAAEVGAGAMIAAEAGAGQGSVEVGALAGVYDANGAPVEAEYRVEWMPIGGGLSVSAICPPARDAEDTANAVKLWQLLPLSPRWFIDPDAVVQGFAADDCEREKV